MLLIQAQGEVLGLRNSELTFHVQEHPDEGFCITEYIINDDISVCVLIDDDAKLAGEVFPCTVEVVDKHDEGGRAVNWAEGHDVIRPFGGVGACKCKFILGAGRDANLVISRRCIPKPLPTALAKGEIDRRIAARDQV
jgi:hypothetical protein